MRETPNSGGRPVDTVTSRVRPFSSPFPIDQSAMYTFGLRRFATAVTLLAASIILAGCGGGWVGDYIPQVMGGLPNNAPPRPGQPGYDEWQEKIRGQAPKDPRKPSAAAQQISPSAPR